MRPVGVVASGSRSFYAPVLIYKDAERIAKEEILVLVRDRVTGREFLGILRWLSKVDPLLPATQRSGVVDNPRLAEQAVNVPFENSYVEILGILSGGKLEPPAEPPTPRSEIYVIESPEDLKLDLGYGLQIGKHKYSGIEIPLDPRYLPYHIVVVGATGTGKSRLVKALIDEVASKTDWKVIVFDHSGVDYVPYYQDGVIDSKLVMPDPMTLGEVIAEISNLRGEYLLDYLVTSIYAYVAYMKGARCLAEDLGMYVKKKGVIEKSEERDKCSIECVEGFNFTDVERLMTEIEWRLDTLLTCLKNVAEKLGARSPTTTKMKLLLSTYAVRFIDSLNQKKLTADDILKKVLSERLAVVDLSTVDLNIRRFIVKALLDRLWRLVDEQGVKPRVLVVVDEAHNYACRECSPAVEAIERTAREGRKWEIGLVLASQRMIDFSTDLRNNVNTFFFSRLQTPGDFENLKGVLDLGGIGADTLSILESREFFFAGLGSPLKYPLLIRVREVGDAVSIPRAS